MDKKLPVYQLSVQMDDDTSGVEFVALVDNPAIERNWLAFSEAQQRIKFAANEEKKIISGPLMVADMPIYRKDKTGEYYVSFSKEAIYTIVRKFFKEGNTSSVNMMHDDQLIPDGVYMIESFLIDRSRMTPPAGFEDLPDGSWFGSYKVDNEKLWQAIKDGVFKGFSIEGNFIPERPAQTVEAAMIDLIKAIIEK